MIKKRLAEKFAGFDSCDERMKRIPDDLNDPQIRKAYMRNHIEWFLKNHPDETEEFMRKVQERYGAKTGETNHLPRQCSL